MQFVWFVFDLIFKWLLEGLFDMFFRLFFTCQLLLCLTYFWHCFLSGCLMLCLISFGAILSSVVVSLFKVFNLFIIASLFYGFETLLSNKPNSTRHERQKMRYCLSLKAGSRRNHDTYGIIMVFNVYYDHETCGFGLEVNKNSSFSVQFLFPVVCFCGLWDQNGLF